MRERRRRGRPPTEQVRRDCARIAELLGAGEDELAIRAELKLSRRAYRRRMGLLQKTAVDRGFVWARYFAVTLARLRQLAEIEDAAMAANPPQHRVAISTMTAGMRLWRELIETGLLLGVITPASPRVREGDGDPTEGLFFGDEGRLAAERQLNGGDLATG